PTGECTGRDSLSGEELAAHGSCHEVLHHRSSIPFPCFGDVMSGAQKTQDLAKRFWLRHERSGDESESLSVNWTHHGTTLLLKM
ncbi:hypothetical protein, partial [Chitinophaga sp. GbtcB8]|uniref:hypothetical protein n=1 Tax=Chitinophaga sp. GbtcB8 TaxID=2824753 RepID=UPI001C2F96BE